MLDVQIALENLYSKQQIAPAIKAEIDRDLEDCHAIALKGLVEFCSDTHEYSRKTRVDLLTYHLLRDSDFLSGEALVSHILAILATVNVDNTPIQAVCGRIAPLLPFKELTDNIKMAFDLLSAMHDCPAYEITYNHFGELVLTSFVGLSEELEALIARTNFLPPMVIAPNKLYSNDSSCYQTVSSHVILGKCNQDDSEVCLDILNYECNIPLTLCEDILPYPNTFKVDELDTPELQRTKRAAHERMCATSKEIHALMLSNGNHFYLASKVDSRGRSYCSGYEITYQGTEYMKAIVSIDEEFIIDLP